MIAEGFAEGLIPVKNLEAQKTHGYVMPNGGSEAMKSPFTCKLQCEKASHIWLPE